MSSLWSWRPNLISVGDCIGRIFNYSVVGIISGGNILGQLCGPKINTTIVNLINKFNENYQ